MLESYQRETFRLETEHWWYRARQKIILSQFRRRFEHRNDLRIIDIGCGAGTFLCCLKEFGRVVGLEASPQAANEARIRSSSTVWTGTFPQGVPENSDPFDVACLFDVIEHLDDDITALASARRLLTRQGSLFVTVPALPWMFGIHDEINEHRRRYTRASLTKALRTAGFTRVWVSYFNFLLSPLLIPAIAWRNIRKSGHHFEVRTKLGPILEQVFGFERHLLKYLRLPFGLSLLAVADTGGAEQPVQRDLAASHHFDAVHSPCAGQ